MSCHNVCNDVRLQVPGLGRDDGVWQLQIRPAGGGYSRKVTIRSIMGGQSFRSARVDSFVNQWMHPNIALVQYRLPWSVLYTQWLAISTGQVAIT